MAYGAEQIEERLEREEPRMRAFLEKEGLGWVLDEPTARTGFFAGAAYEDSRGARGLGMPPLLYYMMGAASGASVGATVGVLLAVAILG